MPSGDDEPPPRSWTALRVLGYSVLALIAGAMSADFETFPYKPLLARPLDALGAYAKRIGAGAPDRSSLWTAAPDDKTGVVRREPDRMAPGATLYTSLPEPSARLVDADGDQLHEWSRPFRSVWSDPPHVDNPVSDDQIGWMVVRMLDGGDLLVSYYANGDSPAGYGLARLDAQSNVVWKYAGRTHHDVTVTSRGEILTLTSKFRDRPQELDGRVDASRVLVDEVVRLSNSGEELQRISLVEAFRRSSKSRTFRYWQRNDDWDVMHTNDVERLGADFAEHHDFADTGDLLLSMRAINAVCLLDPERRRIEWLLRGPWYHQHDPDPLANGNLLVFDNLGHQGPGGHSRIIEIDPETSEIVWRYREMPPRRFQTAWSGEQVPLANGNVLVSSPAQGRIFEVTREGDVVWEFHNPMRREYEGRDYVGALGVQHLARIPADDLEFLESST